MVELVNKAGASRILGVSKPTIERWRREGVLPPPTATVNGIQAWDAAAVRELARSLREEAQQAS